MDFVFFLCVFAFSLLVSMSSRAKIIINFGEGIVWPSEIRVETVEKTAAHTHTHTILYNRALIPEWNKGGFCDYADNIAFNADSSICQYSETKISLTLRFSHFLSYLRYTQEPYTYNLWIAQLRNAHTNQFSHKFLMKEAHIHKQIKYNNQRSSSARRRMKVWTHRTPRSIVMKKRIKKNRNFAIYVLYYTLFSVYVQHNAMPKQIISSSYSSSFCFLRRASAFVLIPVAYSSIIGAEYTSYKSLALLNTAKLCAIATEQMGNIGCGARV